MCIRDSFTPAACEGTSTLFETEYFGEKAYLSQSGQLYGEAGAMAFGKICLLYTSDAADERSSVDLGGRRIIKKKNKK